MVTLTKEEFEIKLFKEVDFFSENGKEKSINFLIWFLLNYYRIDEGLAYDIVCDHKNDKGIDGIYIDNDSKEVILLQSKFREKFDKGEGDGDLRKLVGSMEWFNQENFERIDNSRASKELKDLVKELEVFDRLSEGYSLKALFVTTGYYDRSGKDYITITSDKVEYWDNTNLYDNYTFSGDDELVNDIFTFHSADKVIEVNYSPNSSSYILVAKASELLNLKGIVDRTLFSKNVRYGLGRTNVNKAITATIRNKSLHNKFLLFHNGITIIAQVAETLNESTDLQLTNYSIVNGCQSTLTLYENRNFITDELKIAIKVVQTGENTKLSEEITYFANNQNPINPADLKSREKFQQDLRKQFFVEFHNTIHYKIKRGEAIEPNAEVIENTFAAQLLHSFMNESPYNSHLKTATFMKQYDKIFTRHTDVYLIYLLKRLYDIIIRHLDQIKEPVVRSYQPTHFFILLLVKKILIEDKIGVTFFNSPKMFIEKYPNFMNAFDKLIRILMIQLNSSLEILGEADGHIEYKNILRNATEGKKLATDVTKGYKVLLVHQPESKLETLLTST